MDWFKFNIFRRHPPIKTLAAYLELNLSDCLVMVGTCPERLGNPDFIHLIVVVNRDPETVIKAMAPIPAFRHRRLLVKVMTVTEVVRSLDVFPLEFSVYAAEATVWVGNNVFAPLKIEPAHLRRECEFYLRSASIKIREQLIVSKKVMPLVHHSWPQIMSVLRVLLSPNLADIISIQQTTALLEDELPEYNTLIRSITHGVYHHRAFQLSSTDYAQLVGQLVSFVDTR